LEWRETKAMFGVALDKKLCHERR